MLSQAKRHAARRVCNIPPAGRIVPRGAALRARSIHYAGPSGGLDWTPYRGRRAPAHPPASEGNKIYTLYSELPAAGEGLPYLRLVIRVKARPAALYDGSHWGKRLFDLQAEKAGFELWRKIPIPRNLHEVIKIPIFLGVLVWGDAREKGECG